MPFVRLGAALICMVAAACGGAPADEHAAKARLSPVAAVGEKLFKDTSLSVSGRQSCETCHRPEFADAAPPEEFVSRGGPGMDRKGLRNAPSIRYASFVPPFSIAADGTPSGGLFRDGRAASLAEQAQKPFLDDSEMANPDVASVVARLRRAAYVQEFEAVFGAGSLDDPARAFAAMAAAIAAYEAENPEFHRFDSKYDAWLAGHAVLTPAERRGLDLFNDPKKGNCAACHPGERGADGSPPLFTDHTYDALGLPRNGAIPANADPAFHDLGLCGPVRQDLASRAGFCGAFRVPTLRNVARTAPYFHNAAFRTLREAVDFYARRDTDPGDWYPAGGHGPVKFDDLPEGLRGSVNTDEVPYDRQPGDAPALSAAEVDDLVAFLNTLDDGYRPD